MKKFLLVFTCLTLMLMMIGCDLDLDTKNKPTSDTGVKKVTAKISVNSKGLTAEQENISKRVELEKPGAIKHLYVVSTMSGDCLLYSTVNGKVTSSGKRLTPNTVVGSGGDMADLRGIQITIGGTTYYTTEVLQDDGTYGSSEPRYIYWFDVRGAYHQHYVTGGQLVHISDQPLAWPKIILNLEK